MVPRRAHVAIVEPLKRADDDPHDDRENGEPAPEFAEPLVEHVYGIQPEAGMEDQFTHQDEKGHGEQGEGRNGGEDPGHDPDKTWYSPEEEVGRNHIDDKKGKGNG